MNWNLLNSPRGKMLLHSAWALPIAAYAVYSSPLFACDECCNTKDVTFAATEQSMADRVVPTLASAIGMPPEGWAKSPSEPGKIAGEVCNDASAAKAAAVRAPMTAKAQFHSPSEAKASEGYSNRNNWGYIVKLTANSPLTSNDEEGPKSWNPTYRYDIENLGTFPKIQSRTKITGVRIAIFWADDDKRATPIPAEDLAALKATIDRTKLQALIAGTIPTQESADEMLAANNAESEAFALKEPVRQASRSNSRSKPSQTPAPSGSGAVGGILRKGLGGRFGF